MFEKRTPKIQSFFMKNRSIFVCDWAPGLHARSKCRAALMAAAARQEHRQPSPAMMDTVGCPTLHRTSTGNSYRRQYKYCMDFAAWFSVPRARAPHNQVRPATLSNSPQELHKLIE